MPYPNPPNRPDTVGVTINTRYKPADRKLSPTARNCISILSIYHALVLFYLFPVTHGTGSAVRQGVVIPPSSGQISSQPRGWENCKQHQQQHHRNASSAGTSTLSSIVTAATASATSATFSPAPTTGGGKIAAGRSMGGSASVGDNERAGHTKGPLVAGGRRSGSWGGVSALDREFHVILKAGVDVYKHCCELCRRKRGRGGGG